MIRSRSHRLGDRKAQCIITAVCPNPGMGDRDWETRRITENKWMQRLRSDLRFVLDLILRSDLRFGPAQNEHLVVRTDGHWPGRVFFFRGLLLVSYDLQLSHFVS